MIGLLLITFCIIFAIGVGLTAYDVIKKADRIFENLSGPNGVKVDQTKNDPNKPAERVG